MSKHIRICVYRKHTVFQGFFFNRLFKEELTKMMLAFWDIVDLVAFLISSLTACPKKSAPCVDDNFVRVWCLFYMVCYK